MTFSARVITGRGRGRELGVPTLNLDLRDVPADFPDGLYAGWVLIEGKRYGATIHHGLRPTFGDTRSCEVHLIDQRLPEPPDSVDVEIVQLLRGIEKFDSAEALQKQMQEDIEKTRQIVNS